MNDNAVQLWSDEPASTDLLAFGAVAETAVEAVLDDTLDPIALGISGPWGSGKSTVLKLIRAELESRDPGEEDGASPDQRILVVETEPWRYDPDVGAKGTLILEVLNALKTELEAGKGALKEVKGALTKLTERVNWVKALKLAARTSITLQLPGIDELASLVSEGDVDEASEPRNLDEFQRDFAELLADEHLRHLRRVVVLVDDLDRCLPDTVVDTLETMRLFLSVPKMSFVIAADEDRVADALRDRYPEADGSAGETEAPARLYLHKIVQTTLRLPALSRFDTEAYLLLLLLQRRTEADLADTHFKQIVEGCGKLRISGEAMDSLRIPEGLDVAEEMQFAARLTPILYEKLLGSPRRVKRFLNDLNVRSSIARRRGIELNASVVAKLMVLELLLPKDFETVLRWLARGELRRQLARLDEVAGRTVATRTLDGSEPRESSESTSKSTRANKNARARPGKPAPDTTEDENVGTEDFSDNLIRWAKLPPSLEGIDLSPYLHLAASFAGTPLIDSGLPERLRDVAANLLSSSRASQKSVTDADIASLTPGDVQALIEHLGRMARDRPRDLIAGVNGILRVARVANAAQVAAAALKTIPLKEIKVPVVLLFTGRDTVTYQDLLQAWQVGTDDRRVAKAVGVQLNSQGVN